MLNYYLFILIIISTFFISGNAIPSDKDISNDIPEKYKTLYQELDKKLDDINSHIDSKWDSQKYGTAFCTELLIANSNRGEDLLLEKTSKGIPFTLDKLKELGVKGVVFNIAYPLLMPDFPRSKEYLEFYRKVAKEVKDRGLTLIIETGLIFTEPEISKLKIDYSDLTLEKYKNSKRKMVETIVKEIKPDYLTIENEPDTQHHISGIDLSISNYSETIKYILNGLDKNGVKIGAGAGTWDKIEYFKAAANIQAIDYLDMHIYPIQRNFVTDKCGKIFEIAKEKNKLITCSESWLYKTADSELSEVSSEIFLRNFSRDVFSFWSPLDQKFINVMYRLSNYCQLEFCSFFWMQYFYGYLQYSEAYDNLSYPEKMQELNKSIVKNLISGTLSETGIYLQNLIK